MFRKILHYFLIITISFFVFKAENLKAQNPIQKKIINDITQINPIEVSDVKTPKSDKEVQDIIKNTTGPLSIGGGRFSMGGQIGLKNSLHIDMRSMNKIIAFDRNKKEITVQAGVRWRDIQEYIDPYNLSVKIMQTYSNFTVGGSISVNVHGRYMGEGPLILSLKNLKLVLASGEIKIVSPQQNSELFYAAVGGYGGVGVITEATLLLDENSKIERILKKMDVKEFPKYFQDNVRNKTNIVFFNGDLYPPSYEHVNSVEWYKTDKNLTSDQRLIPKDREYTWLPFLAKLIPSLPFGYAIREYLLEPLYYLFPRIVWRNWEASYDVRELEPGDRSNYTFVLQEYFVPVDQLLNFIPKMRNVFSKYNVDVLNVSIRHAKEDPGSILRWSRGETFALVVYYRQKTDDKSKEEVKTWTRALIDEVISVNGTYYLPYQVHATNEQFLKAYPDAIKYFEIKRKYDPHFRFQNQLINAYYPDKELEKKN